MNIYFNILQNLLIFFFFLTDVPCIANSARQSCSLIYLQECNANKLNYHLFAVNSQKKRDTNQHENAFKQNVYLQCSGRTYHV